jgi:hypothetical protein
LLGFPGAFRLNATVPRSRLHPPALLGSLLSGALVTQTGALTFESALVRSATSRPLPCQTQQARYEVLVAAARPVQRARRPGQPSDR